MRKLLYILNFIFSVLLYSGCEEIFIGPQPNIKEKDDFENSLNIFGILRPDSLDGQPASFVVVSVMYSALNDTSTNMFKKGVDASIEDVENQTVHFLSESTDTLKPVSYYDTTFIPAPLSTYKLNCFKEGYDPVEAFTTIPEKPHLIITSYNQSVYTIEIQYDTSAYLYDIFYYGNDYGYERVLPAKSGNTTVFHSTGSLPDSIDIYSYDKNLAAYYANTNMFIKPNTYKVPFSAVNNGFGCFGSLNKLRFYLK